MKKNSLDGLHVPKSLIFKQILLTMKITLFLFFFVALNVYSENVYSQNAKVHIVKGNMQIGTLLSKIESQTNYLFVYNKKNVDVNRVINVGADNESVARVLDKVFTGTEISYVMEGNNIVLTKSKGVEQSAQQKSTIKGTITDKEGSPIIGANVQEKGTTNGTITDLDGKFTLVTENNATLSITFIGFKSQTIRLSGKTTIKIVLEDESLVLDDVVVTAMGIKKKESSLTYSTTQVNGDELTRSKDPNMINSLTGKTAGVTINKSSSGLGGSAKVIIRGVRSAAGNNQPLYVIDGVPMLNSSSEQAVTAIGGTADAGNRDAGDGISNLNPDDIESMSILKGASAAALYGTQASNGVILITTKKGKSGVQRIQFSSNLTIDHAIELPKFQNSYARTESMTTDPNTGKDVISYGIDSWGPKRDIPAYNNLKDFFKEGVTAINSLSLTSGNENMQTYFSYANTTAKGIIDKNTMSKHNLNFRQTANFFNSRLKLDANVNLLSQTVKNRPTSGGFYMNPLVGLYRFPRGVDITPYKDQFEVYDKDRNMQTQNWYNTPEDSEQNPYWLTNRVESKDQRTRAIVSLTATFKVNDWLSIQARGNGDYISDKFRQNIYASCSPGLAGLNGRYIDMGYQESLYYGDVMAMINKKMNDFTLNAAFGSSISDNTVNSLRYDSKTASLYFPNQFSVANIVMNGSAFIDEKKEQNKQVQSLFATAQLGYKESLYLDVTARNDWSSSLAFTPSASKGFFYPSIGVSWVINNMIDMPSWISFGKVRGSWSQVGNDIPLYVSNSEDHIMAGGGPKANDSEPFDQLKPEMTTSIEFGTEWKFFANRFDVDLTFYKTNTKNQYFQLPSNAGAKYANYYVNAGNIQNIGFEATVGVTPVLTDNFRWKTGFNFSTNKNEIIELHDKLKEFVYGDKGISSSYLMKLKQGGSFGDIYGKAFVRNEKGEIQYNANGLPIITDKGNSELVGNSSPKFMLGWNNTFTYKGFSLYILIDGRFGGKVLSQTRADLDQKGASLESGNARNAGFVELEGRKITNVKEFYNIVGGRNGATEYYMYDATNIRLRELSLGYTFPRKMLLATKFIKDAQLSFVGRNLFFISNKAPFDPDAVLSTGNGNQGIDVYGMPTTRSLGFNLKLTF